MNTACAPSVEPLSACAQATSPEPGASPADSRAAGGLAPGIVQAQITPGARTCIVVGSLGSVGELDLAPYPNLLWIARAPAMPGRFRVDPKKLLILPPDSPDLTGAVSALNRFIELDAVRLPSIFLTDELVGASAAEFLPVVGSIFAHCEKHHRAREFRQQLGFSYQRNILANLSAYARHRVPRSWAGALDGVPAIVCGAGPSLDASAAKLAACAPRAVVFAADSALRALDRRGLAADFCISVDARKTPENCLPPGTRPPARVVLASPGTPAWLEAVPPDRAFFLSGRQATEDLLAKSGVPKTVPEISENCGITAFELAVFLGCRPICLFGMDHAVDTKNPARRHTQELADNLQQQHEQERQPERNRNYAKVPGNFQDEVPTSIFREWSYLDSRCASLPAGVVCNVTDRGARFRNTTVVHPDDFALDAAAADKLAPLARLPAAESAGDPNWSKLRDVFARLARKVEKEIAGAQTEFARGRPRKAFDLLHALIRDQQVHLLLGNYVLKLRPHLADAAAFNPVVWPRLFAECRALCALAKDLH
jgi:hypothetical protein